MISVVIPTKNSGRTLDACLQSLRAESTLIAEVIVVDNFSSDDTQQIAEKHHCSVIVAGPERSAQRNIGLRHVTAPFVIFLDSDMVIEPNVLSTVLNLFAVNPVVGAIAVPEHSFGTNHWAKIKRFERDLSKDDGSVSAARAFKTEELLALGGWNESLLGPEDWELTDRYEAHGHVIETVDAYIWHDEGTPRLRDLYRKKYYYGPGITAYLSTNQKRKSGIVSRFLNRTVMLSLLKHPLQGSSLVLMKSTEFAGAFLGSKYKKPVADDVYRPQDS